MITAEVCRTIVRSCHGSRKYRAELIILYDSAARARFIRIIARLAFEAFQTTTHITEM